MSLGFDLFLSSASRRQCSGPQSEEFVVNRKMTISNNWAVTGVQIRRYLRGEHSRQLLLNFNNYNNFLKTKVQIKDIVAYKVQYKSKYHKNVLRKR